jgi:hypothetical protein
MRNLQTHDEIRKPCAAAVAAYAVAGWLAFVVSVSAQETPQAAPSAQWAPTQSEPAQSEPAQSTPAQSALPQSEPAAPGSAAPTLPRASHKPGLFEAVGRWVDRGLTDIRDHVRGAKQRMDSIGDEAASNSKDFTDKAAAAGKNAADAMPKLPAGRMIDGRERCAAAPNGAPDCLSAAQALCRRHGYASGKSMDFTSAEECPVKALIGQESRDTCKTVTFISRAMCQ